MLLPSDIVQLGAELYASDLDAYNSTLTKFYANMNVSQSFLSFLLLQIQQGVQQKVKEVEPVHRKGGEGLQLHSRPSKCNSAVQAVCYWGFATDCKEKAR